jgi:hypothetical protein
MSSLFIVPSSPLLAVTSASRVLGIVLLQYHLFTVSRIIHEHKIAPLFIFENSLPGNHTNYAGWCSVCVFIRSWQNLPLDFFSGLFAALIYNRLPENDIW